MKKENPFTFVFGKIPRQHISRYAQTIEVTDAFESENPPSQVFLITGVRGSGKTVLMTDIARHFEEDDQWIVVHLNPESDLLASLASKLYEHAGAKGLFTEKSFGVSVAGISASVHFAPPITDAETIVEKMLRVLKDHGKKLLITIDEVSSTPQIRTFVSAFQIFLRSDYPLFLLMTGLYGNIRNLQDEKNLTFLYRAPKIELGPLNLTAVCNSYEEVFGIAKKDAAKLARSTNGYPFAYQMLGFLLWEAGVTTVTKHIEREYDSRLAEFVYDKIWSELSDGDRTVMTAISRSGDSSTGEIIALSGMSPGKLSIYRKRLSENGLIDTSKRGHMYLSLPRFAEFIETQLDLGLGVTGDGSD